MSRFNNPKALRSLLPRPPEAPSRGAALPAPPSAIFTGLPLAAPAQTALAPGPGYETKPNIAQTFCFFMVCTYLLSGYANEFVFHLTRGRAYISSVAVITLPLLYFFTGSMLRGLRTAPGKWWVAFAVWLAVAAPFSVWRGGTASLLSNYYTKIYMVSFFMAACIFTIRQVRTLMRVLGVGALLVVLTCYVYGGYPDGRFAIPNSLFWGNSNELALQLILGCIYLMYPFFEKAKLPKMIALSGIFVSLMYMLKTGSRGVLLATIAAGLIIFVLSRRKLLVVAAAVPALALAFALAPPEMRHRITFIVGDAQEAHARNDMDVSALGSQLQRQELFKTSLKLAITHPLFGVGPGQFAVQVAGEKEKRGEHAEWLGTHNSYTQVASECGLPAFIFYVATILACMRMNYRVYKRSAGLKGCEQIAGASFCMFLGAIVYAIGTFFFHMAYGGALPIVVGVSMSVYLAAKPALEREGVPDF